MAEQELLTKEVKSWKFKIERVAKGYVRLTCHSEDPDELLIQWEKLHQRLEEMGEHVERVEI